MDRQVQRQDHHLLVVNEHRQVRANYVPYVAIPQHANIMEFELVRVVKDFSKGQCKKALSMSVLLKKLVLLTNAEEIVASFAASRSAS